MNGNTEMATKKLIRPDQMDADQIRRLKAGIRQSLELAQRGLSIGSYGMVTARIRYLVTYGNTGGLVRANTFIWQEVDVLPTCPLLGGFLDHWESELDGQIFDLKMTGVPQVRFAELFAAHVKGVN